MEEKALKPIRVVLGYVQYILLAAGAWYGLHGQWSTMIITLGLSALCHQVLTAPPGHPDRPTEPLPASSPVQWGWIAVALVAVYYAAPLLQQPDYNWLMGLPLWLLSGWALYRAFPEGLPVMDSQDIPVRPVRGQMSGIILGVLVLLTFAAVKVVFFFKGTNVPFPLEAVKPGVSLIFGTALAIMLLRWKRPEGKPAQALPREALWVALLILVAALLRYPFIHHLFAGFQGDEANDAFDGVNAMTMSNGVDSPFKTSWGGSPSMPYFFAAEFLKVFGINLIGYRLYTLTACFISVWVFFKWVRFYFSARASLVASFLLAISWWHLYNSFAVFNNNITFLMEVTSFYFLEKALRSGRKVDFWWTGVFFATSVQTYISGRLVSVMGFTAVLACVLIAGRWTFVKTYWKNLLLAALSYLVFISPFLWYILHFPREFLGRAKYLNIFTEVQRTGDHWLPFKTGAFTLLSPFWTTPSPDRRFMIPGDSMVDGFSAFLFLTGLVLAFFTLRRRVSWLGFCGLFFGMLTNALAIQGMNPDTAYINAMRLFLALPFILFLAARGAEWYLGMLDSYGKAGKLLVRVFLIVGFSIAGYYNIHLYYFRLEDRPSDWCAVGYHEVELGKIYQRDLPTAHLMIDCDAYNGVVDFFTGLRQKNFDVITGNKVDFPILYPVTRDVEIFMQPNKLKNVQDDCLKWYPKAVWTDYKNPWGELYARSVRISREDIQALQNGKTVGDPLP